MNSQQAVSQSSFCYSVNMLRLLLSMKLITEDEYNKIVSLSAEYYGTDILCV